MDSLSRALQLPAQRLDAAGRAHVDQRAVLALALPLMANSTVQIVLNLTDMWFMGRISTKALAAVGAVQWLVIVVVLVLGGAGTAVQTLVAQNFGARRYRRAGQAVWTALWAMGCAAPLFVLEPHQLSRKTPQCVIGVLQIRRSFPHLRLECLMTFQKAFFGTHPRPVQMTDDARCEQKDAHMYEFVATDDADPFR